MRPWTANHRLRLQIYTKGFNGATALRPWTV